MEEAIRIWSVEVDCRGLMAIWQELPFSKFMCSKPMASGICFFWDVGLAFVDVKLCVNQFIETLQS